MGAGAVRPGMRISPLTITIGPLTTDGTITAITTIGRHTLRRITKGTTIVGTAASTRKMTTDGQIGLRWASNPSPKPKSYLQPANVAEGQTSGAYGTNA